MRTTPIEQYFLGIGLRTTPFDQYFMGIDFFKNWPNRVELVLKKYKLRTTPFDQYFLDLEVRTTHFEQYFLGFSQKLIKKCVELAQGS